MESKKLWFVSFVFGTFRIPKNGVRVVTILIDRIMVEFFMLSLMNNIFNHDPLLARCRDLVNLE